MTSPAGVAAHLLRTLRTWPWFETVRILRQRFREDRLGLTASSLTFTTLIALVPLVTVTLAVFTAFPMFGSLQGSLESYLVQSLVPDNIAKPVLRYVTQFAGKASRLGTVGLLVLGLTALALMFTIDRTLNNIWRVRKARPLAQRVLVYWAALTLGPLVLGLSVSATSYALTASKGLVGAMPGALSFALDVAEFVLLATGVAGLFHYVPNTWVRWRHAWAGALFVAVAFEGAKRGLAWYVNTMPTFAIYGAFATVPILLLWVYLGWLIMLLGAVIAAYAPSLQRQVQHRPDTPGARFELALAVLRELMAARATGERGLSMASLADGLRADALQLEPVLQVLVQLDWAAVLDERGAPRYVLLCDTAHTAARPLLDALLLAPGELGDPLRQRAGFDALQVSDLLAAPPLATAGDTRHAP